MLFRFIYNAALTVFACCAAPKMWRDYKKHGKYRNSIKARLGKDFPQISKGPGPVIWFHAVSVGEVKAIAPLAQKIKEAFAGCRLLVTTITETGQAEAHKSIPYADAHGYLPIDWPSVIRPIVKKIAPDLVIVAEGDHWHHFLSAAKGSGAHLALVNGKISKKTFSRLSKLPWAAKQIVGLYDLYCVQGEEYATRFRKLGIKEDRIHITGNLKFDSSYPVMGKEERCVWHERLNNRPVIVAGSTHDPEEKLLLEQCRQLSKEFPDLLLILVPRHPDRFKEVEGLVKTSSLPYTTLSILEGDTAASLQDKAVLIVDKMGALRDIYQLADIAYVAGTFTDKVGGHNITEPSYYGIPVVYGPHIFSQPDLHLLAQEYNAAIQVHTPQELYNTLLDLLKNPDKRRTIGDNGKKLFQHAQGATDRTIALLETTGRLTGERKKT
ncbi:3-deoxy-D-manno-octulosonic acid transferase [Simkania negevensis]|uniref:3-deoxy-D-manno-octulosonic acid transferase n=1 Tax=Simkania negevensis TaxID=83561 RepID=A0ABS3AQS3_9BACT|nr:3-deoxy-D-manno-octulosonic acid transferase [Simkania negevensis]